MQKSKLLRLIQSLDLDELKRLGRFIRSPYYGYNPHLSTLYEYLRKYYPNFDSSKLHREQVFAKLFPDEVFSWNKLKKLMSALTNLVEEYLITLELELSPFQKKKWLTKALGRRHVFNLFDRETRYLLNDLETQPYRDMMYYQEQVDLYASRYFHPQFDRYNKKDRSMEQLVDSLDRYFVLAKMRYGTEVRVRERIFPSSYRQRFLEGLVQEKNNGLLADNPAFCLYDLLQQVLEEGNEDTFNELEKDLFNKIIKLQRIDQQVVFFHGLNFIIRKTNQGLAGYSARALAWYRLGLNEKLLIEQGIMSTATFGNIIIYGCLEKEFQWTKDFMESYQCFLKIEDRQDAFAFNKGIWHFYQNEFEEVLSFLTMNDFSRAYLPKVRLTQIRAIFEQFLKDDSYFETLMSRIQAFDIFIKRNHFFTKQSLEPFLNSIKIIEKLAKQILKNEKKETILIWLENKVKSKKVISKNWLLEKVDDLKH